MVSARSPPDCVSTPRTGRHHIAYPLEIRMIERTQINIKRPRTGAPGGCVGQAPRTGAPDWHPDRTPWPNGCGQKLRTAARRGADWHGRQHPRLPRLPRLPQVQHPFSKSNIKADFFTTGPTPFCYHVNYLAMRCEPGLYRVKLASIETRENTGSLKCAGINMLPPLPNNS